MNNIEIAKNKEIPLTHLETIEFGVNVSIYVFTFHIMPNKSIEEPPAKKIRIPLASLLIDSKLMQQNISNLVVQQKVTKVFKLLAFIKFCIY